MSTTQNFLSDYNEGLKLYKQFKRDYICVNLLYTKFLQENGPLEEDIKKAKLNKLINTHSIQRNHLFSKSKYNKCFNVWQNIENYLELNIWSAINHLENKNDFKALEKAKVFYKNILFVVKTLGLQKINIYGGSINDVLNRLKNEINKNQK